MLNKASSYHRVITILITVTILFNILACSTNFCDAYTENIYGMIADAGSIITDRISVAVGELLMYVGAVFVIVFVLLMFLFVFFRKRNGYVIFLKKYIKCLILMIVIVLFIYTVNWIIPLRSSLLGKGGEVERYIEMIHIGEDSNDTVQSRNSDNEKDDIRENKVLKSDVRKHLFIIRTYIVDNLNELVDEVPRDSDGRIIYSEKNETEKKVALSMQKVSNEFSRLSGIYPQLKFAFCSEILNYMWIGGYTYPYTMEVTGNKYTDKLYYQSLYAHESAHHHGYYRENEANLLEYIACINSDDSVIRYSGFLSMYYYIDDAYLIMLSKADDNLWDEYNSVQVSERVWVDSRQSIDESDEEFADDDKPMQQFENAASDVAGVGWDTQAELLGEDSYDGVVDLMLWYYDGKIY